jgi:hypothetical protein
VLLAASLTNSTSSRGTIEGTNHPPASARADAYASATGALSSPFRDIARSGGCYCRRRSSHSSWESSWRAAWSGWAERNIVRGSFRHGLQPGLSADHGARRSSGRLVGNSAPGTLEIAKGVGGGGMKQADGFGGDEVI